MPPSLARHRSASGFHDNGPSTASKLAKQYPKPSRLSEGLPAGLDALIDAGLESDPDKRITSAAAFVTRLELLMAAAPKAL